MVCGAPRPVEARQQSQFVSPFQNAQRARYRKVQFAGGCSPVQVVDHDQFGAKFDRQDEGVPLAWIEATELAGEGIHP